MLTVPRRKQDSRKWSADVTETLAYSDAAFDLVSHVAPAHVTKIGGDRAPAFQIAWFARRIVTIDYLNNGIFTIQGG
jgi:hypothetical protein